MTAVDDEFARIVAELELLERLDVEPLPPPPWHRPARFDWRRMAGDVAVMVGLAVAGWLPAAAGVWLLVVR